MSGEPKVFYGGDGRSFCLSQRLFGIPESLLILILVFERGVEFRLTFFEGGFAVFFVLLPMGEVFFGLLTFSGSLGLFEFGFSGSNALVCAANPFALGVAHEALGRGDFAHLLASFLNLLGRGNFGFAGLDKGAFFL